MFPALCLTCVGKAAFRLVVSADMRSLQVVGQPRNAASKFGSIICVQD